MNVNTVPIPGEQKEGKKSRRVARVLLWATVWGTVLLGLAMINLPRKSVSDQAAIEAAIVKSVNAIRPTLPRKLDQFTTLVAVHHAEGKVQYEFVIDLSKAASRPATSFASQMRAQALQSACKSEIMLQSLRVGVSYEYVYRDENSNDLGSFMVSNSDCKV